MRTLRLACVAIAVFSGVSAFATNARVESMGKNSTFIMDDISIFDNPANINLYPNFLIGELGNYLYKDGEVGVGQNRDPLDPWFGGIFALDIGGGNSLSIAGVLNRKEERLFKYFPEYIGSAKAPAPVTNFDGFLGANFNNKAVGLHIYVAHQDGLSGNRELTSDAHVSALQLDGGINFELSNEVSIEVSGGVARMQYGSGSYDFFDGDLISGFASARIFSKVQAINGHLIPAASFRNMTAPGREEMEINGGMGVDAAFDRGFFWIGLQGFYNIQRAGNAWTQELKPDGEFYSTFAADSGKGLGEGPVARLWQLGGTISFGIERNIWWDWFVLRVGGQKTIAYADYTAGNEFSVLCPNVRTVGLDKAGCPEGGNYFYSNPVNDGTRNDHVGFGIGINVEEKLKIDATIAEDVVFRNPFQGEGRLISRVSATYSF